MAMNQFSNVHPSAFLWLIDSTGLSAFYRLFFTFMYYDLVLFEELQSMRRDKKKYAISVDPSLDMLLWVEM